MHKKYYSTNTVGKNIKNIKVFLKEAYKRGLTTNKFFEDEDFRVVEENTEQIYLKDEEIIKLYNLDLTANERLRKVRDLFIIGCYLLIPVSLCYYVLKKRLNKSFQIYLWLKLNFSGKCQIDNNTINDICNALKIKTKKTVKTGIKKLLEINFIGYNKLSDYYFIRGFDSLRILLKMEGRSCVIFRREDLTQIKELCFAAIIGNYIKKQERKRRKTDLRRGRSKQSFLQLPSYYPVSLGIISKLVNISISTAHNYVQMAEKYGYLKSKNDFEEISKIEEKVNPLVLINNLRKYHPEIGNKLFIRENKILIQRPDLYLYNVMFSRRKKLKHI